MTKSSRTTRSSGKSAGRKPAGPARKGYRGPSRLITSDDLYLFNEGSHFRLYDKLGAHPLEAGGVHFAVWAPNAARVSVIGDFNDWRPERDVLEPAQSSGIWRGVVPDAAEGACYKFHVESNHSGYVVDKADPFAFCTEEPPKTASVVWQSHHEWADTEWMTGRRRRQDLASPISIYEVHLGSWARDPSDPGRLLPCREVAAKLAEYVSETGFTHVELLPVMEHPFYGSWGYQTTSYFAPSRRYGTPDDFMFMIDTLHRRGIGVILDWVPSHFPSDEHGLGFFDGTHLFEHSDPRQGFHPEWNSLIFNYGRKEVQAFLISSACYWLDRFHADGLRVDAVASMLYRDYARMDGNWIPNEYGGRENLEAIAFLKRFNREVYAAYPDVQTFAEESTAWPMVSKPVHLGGLGFGFKWDMGWMHDTLSYFSRDPIHRSFHHNELTFRSVYGYSENYVLPLSHDEVVYGKGSLLAKMPGDSWQRFAGLRLLLSYMFATPGKKLLFMGAEFGQWNEWYHENSLDWHLLDEEKHRSLRLLVGTLNHLYATEKALFEGDCEPGGFQWVDCNDSAGSILSFLRIDRASKEPILAVCNFTPVTRKNYRIGVDSGPYWRELLNSDAAEFGGSGQGNMGMAEFNPVPCHGREGSVVLTLPPLAALYLKREGSP